MLHIHGALIFGIHTERLRVQLIRMQLIRNVERKRELSATDQWTLAKESF